MAAQASTQKFRSNFSLAVYDHDPDTGSAIVVTPDAGTTDRYLDMSQYGHFVVVCAFTTGTAVTKVEIVAASDTAGTDLTVIKDSGSITLNALGEFHVEECSAEEVAQAGASSALNLRYVGARITSSSGDEALVTYIGMEPAHSYLNLTPATTIS